MSGGWRSHNTRWWLFFILTLITPCPLPSWAAVTGPSDVVTGGVVEAVTYLATAVAIGPCRTLWEGSESPVQPWEPGARLSLTVWPWVSGGHCSQGSLFRLTCTTQSAWELASFHGVTHRPGDTVSPHHSPSSQLLTLSASMYPRPGWVGTEPVESQRNWLRTTWGDSTNKAMGWKETRLKNINERCSLENKYILLQAQGSSQWHILTWIS